MSNPKPKSSLNKSANKIHVNKFNLNSAKTKWNHASKKSKVIICIATVIVILLCGFGIYHHNHGVNNVDVATVLPAHTWKFQPSGQANPHVNGVKFSSNNMSWKDQNQSINLSKHYIKINIQDGYFYLKLIKHNGRHYYFHASSGNIEGRHVIIHGNTMKVGHEKATMLSNGRIKVNGHITGDNGTGHSPLIPWEFTEE